MKRMITTSCQGRAHYFYALKPVAYGHADTNSAVLCFAIPPALDRRIDPLQTHLSICLQKQAIGKLVSCHKISACIPWPVNKRSFIQIG
jgi:hypothetical protein